MKILALDPGECTGWALIEVHHGLRALGYGIVPRLHPGISGLVRSTREWLEWAAQVFELRTSDCDVTFEEAIGSYQLKTRREGLEVRGVIREWCATNKPVDSFAYTPQQVRMQLGLPLKGTVKSDMRLWVERALGYKPCGPDHVTDAIGVGLCHALKIGAWRARIVLPERSSIRAHDKRGRFVGDDDAAKVPARIGEGPADRMTCEEFRRKLAAGELVYTGGMSFREGGRR